MIAIRWTLTVVLGLLWLMIAAINGWFEWRRLVRKEERVESVVPFVGGIFAYLAANVCPWDSPLKGLSLWLALILDVGSLPYFILLIVALAVALADDEQLKEEVKKTLTLQFWKKRYAESSWVVKLAVWFGGWLFLSIPLTLTLSAGLGLLHGASFEEAFWAFTVIYWAVHVMLHFRRKQWKLTGKDG